MNCQAPKYLHLFFCMALFTFSERADATSRKDIVIMNNGDRFTGEVKSLQNGVLYLKTDYVAENIGVDWSQVRRIESTAVFQITLVNGRHLTGKIKRETPEQTTADEFSIVSPSGSLEVPSSNVAEFSTQKETFWRQLKGSLDAGYSYTSGNGQTTINNDADASYSTPNWISGVSLSTSYSGQSDASHTNRIDGTITTDRFLNHNSYLGLYNDYLHSSQQELALRATIGGGYGRYWIRTNTATLRWLAGAVYTNETFNTTLGQPNDSNVEGLLGAAYDSYRFRFGEIHLQGIIFPGLTDAGRIRLTTNNSLRIKLVNNFYFSVGFWDNFDSRPPVSAKNNELGVSSSIGWSF